MVCALRVATANPPAWAQTDEVVRALREDDRPWAEGVSDRKQEQAREIFARANQSMQDGLFAQAASFWESPSQTSQLEEAVGATSLLRDASESRKGQSTRIEKDSWGGNAMIRVSFLFFLNLTMSAMAGCAWIIGIEDLPEVEDGSGGAVDAGQGCGNGMQEFGEACDDGRESERCDFDCSLAECGDGSVNQTAGEKCDDGNRVSEDGCRADCKVLETCGDGGRDFGELCDDGNTASGDGCSADCLSIEVCSNGYVDVVKGEVCDEGGITASCDADCTAPECGDGDTNPLFISPISGWPEQCDEGGDSQTCDADCTSALCGDGYINDTFTVPGSTAPEECDDGNQNSDQANAGCRTNCLPRRCGDSIVDNQFNEQCDSGASNSNVPNAACRTNCLPQRCGDSIVDNQLNEQCDNGANNGNAPNACRASCQNPRCGDGVVDDAFGEQCERNNDCSGINTCTGCRCG